MALETNALVERAVKGLSADKPMSFGRFDWSLEDAFPAVDPGITPCGSLLLVQIRTPPEKTAGGIIMVQDTKDTELWNTQVGKVIAVGPLAFRKRDTMEQWPEGAWVQAGDFIRIPKYVGDRWQVPIPGRADNAEAMFLIIEDHKIIGKINADPLRIKAFL